MRATSREALAAWVSTVGPVGHVPVAPGTAGALVASLAGFALVRAGGSYALAALALVVLCAGQWSCMLRRDIADDPREVVIDEVAGQMVALVGVAPHVGLYACALILFRVFDVWKPWPINIVDRSHHSWSVMGDDLVAGVMARCLLFPLELLL